VHAAAKIYKEGNVSDSTRLLYSRLHCFDNHITVNGSWIHMLHGIRLVSNTRNNLQSNLAPCIANYTLFDRSHLVHYNSVSTLHRLRESSTKITSQVHFDGVVGS